MISYPSAKSFRPAWGSEARASVMAPIQLAKNSPARRGIRRRGWIISSLDTIQTFKAGSPVLILKTPDLIQKTHRAGMGTLTLVTILFCTVIQTDGSIWFVVRMEEGPVA